MTVRGLGRVQRVRRAVAVQQSRQRKDWTDSAGDLIEISRRSSGFSVMQWSRIRDMRAKASRRACFSVCSECGLHNSRSQHGLDPSAWLWDGERVVRLTEQTDSSLIPEINHQGKARQQHKLVWLELPRWIGTKRTRLCQADRVTDGEQERAWTKSVKNRVNGASFSFAL